MITAINIDNSNLYKALFEKAETVLRETGNYSAGVHIDTLEDYFCLLEDLTKYGGKQYTILPLNEPYFTIKANERLIQVPDEFKKHGISVQGDQVAEIVYFKIDRYFDFTDLNNADIYIQWQSINEPTNYGVSKEWVRDIESEKDSLIFGWPLDSRITSVAGPIKFSVRFVLWKTDSNGNIITNPKREIVYSFSTLDAQATINPALNYGDMELNIDNRINEMILSRVKNSEVTDKTVIPEKPYFVVGFPSDSIELSNTDQGGKTYTFKVQAYADDGGAITYKWYRQNKKDQETVETELTHGTVEYILSTDEEWNSKSIYYERVEGDKYVAVSNEIEDMKPDIIYDDDNNPIKVNNTYYEKFGVLTILDPNSSDPAKEKEESVIGEYYVDAINTIGAAPSVASDKVRIGPAIVHGPEAVVFDKQEEEGCFISKQDDGSYLCSLSAKVEAKPNNLIVGYNWKFGDEVLESVADLTIKDINPSFNITTTSINDQLQGVYTLEAISERNGTKTTSEKTFNVTYDPVTPKLSYEGLASNNTMVLAGDTIKINVSYDLTYQNGKNYETYKWYKVDKSGEKINDEIIGQSNTLSTQGLSGFVRCEVVNTYNTKSTEPVLSNIIGIVG